MNKPKKIIGILGGMGPAATANFFSDVVTISQEKYSAEQDTDYPVVYLYNAPLDGFNETGFDNPELVKNQLVEFVKKLESWGSDFIVIPCNTVHYYISEMRNSIKIPIISIIESTVDEIKNKKYSKVGIISSTSTKNLKLYEDALIGNGIECILTNNIEQNDLDSIILAVMSGKQGERERSIMKNIAERMSSEGAQAVILGCTELPLAISESDTQVPLLNTIRILAENGVKETYS